jgi:hypothetical protein
MQALANIITKKFKLLIFSKPNPIPNPQSRGLKYLWSRSLKLLNILPWKLSLGFGGPIDSGRTDAGRQTDSGRRIDSERAGRRRIEAERRTESGLRRFQAGRRRVESGPHRIERGRPLVLNEAGVAGQQKEVEVQS